MEETVAYAEKALAGSPNVLEQLFKQLIRQRDLIYKLEDRLRPVSSPQPRNDVASPGLQEGTLPHLAQAVDVARSNNEQIEYLIATLVV